MIPKVKGGGGGGGGSGKCNKALDDAKEAERHRDSTRRLATPLSKPRVCFGFCLSSEPAMHSSQDLLCEITGTLPMSFEMFRNCSH